MMAPYTAVVIFVAINFSVIGFTASETCYFAQSYNNYDVYEGTKYYLKSKYCSSSVGCCYTYRDSDPCCSSDTSNLFTDAVSSTISMSTTAIIGIAVGCLFGLSLLVAIIVCCVACCRSQGSRQGGHVLTPMGGVGATVITTQTATPQQAYPQAQLSSAMGQSCPGYNPSDPPADSTPTAGPGSAPDDTAMSPPLNSKKY
ncbi:uncharacterized protein LOC117330953 [Pecten maximus]|uniref:uncharacterized protein LOC117330953 n=1 Tax=Pecten maximus TaxID=6579 RepID=UPI001457F7F9|nr:uncharacterized protein LOC117330953 [Pecten maximus]